MCMKLILKRLKQKEFTIGYKIAYKNDDGTYSPVYVRKHAERWTKGKWHKADYSECQCWKNKATEKLTTYLTRAIRELTLNQKEPLIRSGSGGYYHCGFHFWLSPKDARDRFDSCGFNYNNEKVILKCELRGVKDMGRQWGKKCFTATQMKPVREIMRPN